MIIIKWNPLVNDKFALDGEYGYKDDSLSTIEFESGKSRTILKNSYIPKIYPSINLVLDNNIPVTAGKENTEFRQFDDWYKISLRYGTLPFYAPRIGYKKDTAIYKFIPESLNYDGVDGIITATFGLIEESYIESELLNEKTYLVFEDGSFFATEDGTLITL